MAINLFLTFLFIVSFTWTIKAQQITITYSNPGNGNVIIPNYSTNVQGEAWGGGGGGGGVYSGALCQSNGGGGGGGAYTSKIYQGGITLFLKVGKRGERGENNANGNSGEESTITYNTTIIAGGGNGGTRNECAGVNNTSGMGGTGGTAIGGDINISGGTGYNYNASPASSGGGSPNGGSITGQPNNGNYAISGNFPGGGGSGARENGCFFGCKQPGGHGANGQVKVTFTLPTNTLSLTSNACEDEDLIFSITNYQSNPYITYTLVKGSVEIGIFNGSTYTITNTTTSDNGNYTVVASYNFQDGHLQTGGSVSGTTTVTSNPINVIINPKPNITVTSQSICSGESFSFPASSLGTDIVTISWTAPTFNNASGTPSTSETDKIDLAGALISSLTTDGAEAVYVVTPKSSTGCVGVSKNFTININTVPTINGPIDTIICSGEGFTLSRGNIPGTTSSTEFKWTVASNPNVTLTTDGSAYTSEISASNIVNNTSVSQILIFTITYHRSSACQSIEKTFTMNVTVDPKPVFSVTNPAAVCSPNMVDIASSISGLTPVSSIVKYYTSNASGNLGGEFTNTIVGTGTYYIQATAPEGCKSEAQSVTVTVNPTPVINGEVVVCEDATVHLQTDIAGGTWSVEPISLASISTEGVVSGIAAGDVTITYTVNNCSNTHAITVNPKPVIETTSMQTMFCAGETVNFDLTTATQGLTGSWSFTTPPIASTIDASTGIFTAGNISLSQSPATISIQYITDDACKSDAVPLTVKYRPNAPQVYNPGIECTDNTSSDVIDWSDRVALLPSTATLNWYLDANKITSTSQPAAVPVNTTSNATFYVAQSYDGCESDATSITIQLDATPYISDITIYNECADLNATTPVDILTMLPPSSNILTWWTDQSGSATQIITPDLDLNKNVAGTYNWYAKQTTTSGCESNIYKITAIVKTLPAASISGDATICYGNSTNLSIDFSAGTPPFAYTYTDGTTSQNVPNTSNNPDIQTISPLITKTYTLIYLEDANGCEVSTALGAANLTGSATITVKNKPAIDAFTASELCAGTDLIINPTVNEYGEITTYSWTLDGTEISTTQNLNYTVEYTDNGKTLILKATNTACGSDDHSMVLSAKDRPTITEALTDNWSWSPVCEGSSFDIENKVGHYLTTFYNHGTSQPSYWIIATTPGGTDPYSLNYTGLSRPYTATYADSGKWIGLVALNECGTDTVFAQLGVRQKPILNINSTAICSGEAVMLTPPHTGDIVPTGTTFSWDRGTVVVNGTTSTWNSGGATAIWGSSFIQTLTNTGGASVDQVYYLYAKNGNDGSGNACISDFATYTVTINPKAAITDKSYTICSGDAFTFSTTGSDIVPVGTTYTWTVSNNSNISGQSDVSTASSTVSQTLINNTTTDQTVVYTVTPNAGSCQGSSFTVTVIVRPTPRVSISSDNLCEEEEITLSFIGSPSFALDYTIDYQNVGTDLTPASLSLPTEFGVTMTGGTWNGSNKTATIKPGTPGVFIFKLTKITDAHGCETEKP